MTLDKLLIQVRRIAEHRQLGAEKQIRAAYKRTLSDLKKFIGYEFAQYAEDGKLTYDILAKKQNMARFLEEVQQNIDGLSPETQAEISECVSDIYKLSYEGMTDAVLKAAPKTAADALQGLSFVQPTQVISGVNNELINKITLKDVLEKNRRNVIYDLKQAVIIGITNGETVDMMSRRVSGVLDGDYKKAVRVVRTEAHRVREMGLSDSARNFDEELQKTDTGLRMVKIWRTMKDDRVRPNRRYKTKKGWRTMPGSGANHQKMEGQTVLATDMFELTDGHKTVSPGQSGIAAQDINCRCFVQYKLVDNTEFVKLSSKNKFTNEDNSDIIKEKGKKGITPITDGAIKGVPKVKINGYTDEQCTFIQEQHKELLKYARDNNDNKEAAFVFRKGLTDRTEYIGGDDSLDFGTALLGKGNDIFIMHNHPRNSGFSTTDIKFFVNCNTVRTLTIAKNNGDVEYILKAKEFNASVFNLEYERLKNKIVKNGTLNEYEKFINKLLSKTKSGLEWSKNYEK